MLKISQNNGTEEMGLDTPTPTSDGVMYIFNYINTIVLLPNL